jgi:ubiquitin-like 1-activating enzyme E1 B
MLFDKVFKTDIERLRSMEDVWKNRRPPEPLDFATLYDQASQSLASGEPNELLAKTADIIKDDQRIWTLEENLAVYIDSLRRLSARVKQARGANEEDIIPFDKDDEDTLDFVAASANFRASLFGIECKSKFDIKQMAGNIIPAIATTNAIVAGLCVLQAFKVLRGEFDTVKEVFLTPFNTSRLLAPDRLRQPNPECPVCSVFQLSVRLDRRAKVQDLVDFVQGQLYGGEEREFVLNNDVGILYDADETSNLTKNLTDLGVAEGSFLTIIDDEDDPFVNVVINIESLEEGQVGESVENGPAPDRAVTPVTEIGDIPRKPKKMAVVSLANGANGANGTHKRAHDEDGVVESLGPKKAKVTALPTPQDDVVIIDDANGAIVIDDE